MNNFNDRYRHFTTAAPKVCAQRINSRAQMFMNGLPGQIDSKREDEP